MALTDNIRAGYKLSNTTDDSGNGYTLTNTGTVTFGTGLVGNAALFGTSNTSKLLNTGSAGIALGDNWTVSFFWKADTALNGLSIMEVTWGATGSGNSNRCLFGRDQANGRWIIFNSDFSSGSTTESISNGTWYHVLATRSGSTLTLYINNVSKGTASVGSATTQTPRIGTGYQNDSGWRLSGDVDCWYIWNRALDSTDRGTMYNSGSGYEISFATDATVTPSVVNATFAIPTYTPSATQNPTVSPATVNATFTAQTVAVTSGATLSPSTVNATFGIPAYSITTADTTIYPDTVNATFAIPAYTPTAEQNTEVTVSTVNATFAIPAYTVSVTASVTIAPSTVNATFSILTYSVLGDFWNNKFSDAPDAWSDKLSASADSWNNKY